MREPKTISYYKQKARELLVVNGTFTSFICSGPQILPVQRWDNQSYQDHRIAENLQVVMDEEYMNPRCSFSLQGLL
jgi:hypothetical protein